MLPIGELAALGTAICWCGSALSFEAAGKRIGSLSVNIIRLVLALAFLSLAGWLARGLPLPTDASSHAWIWLSVSGLIGFTFGDLCLFRAFVVLGSRLSVLIMTMVPPITAIIGWAILGETLSWLDIGGMTLTVVGVALALTERFSSTETNAHETPMVVGILLALGGALGQAGGLVLSKYGMGAYNAMAATQIRIIAGALGFALLFLAIGWWPRVWASRRSPSGLGLTSLGALFGPVLGVTLSLYAVQHVQTGIASSIMATTPLLIIPIGAMLDKQAITVRSVAGAGIAIIGVTLLFL